MDIPSDGDRFLVRTDAGWTVTSPTSQPPAPLDLASVLELLGRRSVDASEDVGSTDLGDWPQVEPAWAIVGRVCTDGLEIDGPGGAPMYLDATDVEMIECCDPATPMPNPTGGVVAPSRRAARLRAAGVLVPAGRRPHTSPPLEPSDAAASGRQVAPTPPGSASGAAPPRRRRSLLHRWTSVSARRSAPSRAKVPVLSVWYEEVGPALSLGMLLAAAKAHDGGRLCEAFDFRPMGTGDDVVAQVGATDGPVVLLCSNYLWSVDHNLDVARRARAANPDLVVIHGGPSTPSYETDVADFLRANADVAHVLVRGEGEATLCELLAGFARHGGLDDETLRGIDGISFLDASGQVVRTADRERIADLPSLPSPYLTGEFDHIDASAWPHGLMHVETNRGCPYGCTFCDWGSATMARVRRFDVERVLAEARWGQQHGFAALNLCDANFGILPQDEVIAERLIALRDETGFPLGLALTLAKNSTSRVIKVVERFLAGGMPINSCISLQSVDPTTIAAVHRDNISVDVYVALAATFRRWGYGLQSDMILGLPGQTLDSFRDDLQFMFDHEIMARTWPARLLPNSPMNAPEYRREHRIDADELGMVCTTSTLGHRDRDEAMRLRNADIVFDRYGVLRHVLRLLQWDHGLPALEVEHRILRTCTEHPDRYPLLSWVLSHFDLYPTVPVGWRSFYDEVRRFVVDELGVAPGSDLDTVLEVQQAVMPAPGREFPDTVALPHDYVAYYLGAVRSLYTTGEPGRPVRSLAEMPPGELTISADPLGLCDKGLLTGATARGEILESDYHLGSATANELMSPIVRVLPVLGAMMGPMIVQERLELLGIDRDAWSSRSSGEQVLDLDHAEPVALRPSRA